MKKYLTIGSLLALPYIAFAQTPRNFADLVGLFIDLIRLLIPIVFGLAFIVFIWGLIKAWIIGGGDPKSVSDGKQIAFWGVVAFIVMAGIWGILALLQTTLGF